MSDLLERVRRFAWGAVEAAAVLVLLCVFLDIILGPDGGGFVATVAGNATKFLQSVPPGALLGVALLVGLYWFYRARQRG